MLISYLTDAIYEYDSTTGRSVVLPDFMTKNKNSVSNPYDSNICFLSLVWNEFNNTEIKKLDNALDDIKKNVCDHKGIRNTIKGTNHRRSTQTEHNHLCKNYQGFDLLIMNKK